MKTKKLRKKKKYNLKSKITSALRRIWFYGPTRRECMKEAKARGNTCGICNNYNVKLQADHIIPCASLKGWDGDWTGYIDRMMYGKLMAICPDCHHAKTTIARNQRKSNKKVDKIRK